MDLSCVNHQPNRPPSRTCNFVFVAFTSAASWMFDRLRVRHHKPRNGIKGDNGSWKDEGPVEDFIGSTTCTLLGAQSAYRSSIDYQLQSLISLAVTRYQGIQHNNNNICRNLIPSATASHMHSRDWLGRYATKACRKCMSPHRQLHQSRPREP